MRRLRILPDILDGSYFMNVDQSKRALRFLIPVFLTGAVLVGCSPTTGGGAGATPGEPGTYVGGKYVEPPPRRVGRGGGR